MSGLSRRALFPAAVGGALAAPEAAKAAMQYVGDAKSIRPPIGSAFDYPPMKAGPQRINPAEIRRGLLEDKARFERYARGEFEEAELSDHDDHDPRRRKHDTSLQEIVGLKSVSPAHKIRMAQDLGQRRYRAYRQKDAAWSLQNIIERLAGL